LQKDKSGQPSSSPLGAASKAESDMDPGSVGRKAKPKVRVVSMTEMAWFVVSSVMGITVPRIIMMLSMNPVVPAMILVMFPVTSFVMLPVITFVMVPVASFVMVSMSSFVVVPVSSSVMLPMAGAIVVIPCLRWSRPSDQKHSQKSGYYNLADVFHFDSPFIGISRTGDEKGYGFIKKFLQRRRHGWVEKEKRSRSSAFSLKYVNSNQKAGRV
jgi:hypothetical protein